VYGVTFARLASTGISFIPHAHNTCEQTVTTCMQSTVSDITEEYSTIITKYQEEVKEMVDLKHIWNWMVSQQNSS